MSAKINSGEVLRYRDKVTVCILLASHSFSYVIDNELFIFKRELTHIQMIVVLHSLTMGAS